MPEDGIGAWARGHGLPVYSIDGNDVAAGYASALDAVAHIRADGRPRFIELQTSASAATSSPMTRAPARGGKTRLAEAIIAGTAVGAAASGLRPVIDLLFAPFMAYAMDALVNTPASCVNSRAGNQFPVGRHGLTGTGWCAGPHTTRSGGHVVHAPASRR